MQSTHLCFHVRARGLTAAFFLAAASLPLYAATMGDAVHACAQEANDAKRLVCYDGVAGRTESAAALSAAAAAPAAPRAAAPAQAAKPVAAPAPEVTASITKLSRRADGRYVITLSNGDVWMEAELKERFQANEGESVTVRTQFLGARYLRTQHGFDVRVIPGN